MSYHKQLKLFLDQAKTDNLTTKQYERPYFGLKVKVGFGKPKELLQFHSLPA